MIDALTGGAPFFLLPLPFPPSSPFFLLSNTYSSRPRQCGGLLDYWTPPLFFPFSSCLPREPMERPKYHLGTTPILLNCSFLPLGSCGGLDGWRGYGFRRSAVVAAFIPFLSPDSSPPPLLFLLREQ